jgi:AraC family transcriptional activator of pobA
LNRDDFLLSEFKKALARNSLNPVIDLDEKFPHKIDLFSQVYEILVERIGDQVPPNKWSHYRLGLIREGSADYSCGIYKFKIEKDTLLIIPPRVVSSSSGWTADCKGYFLLFNVDFFLQSHFPHHYLGNKRILQASIKPYIPLGPTDADHIEEIFKTILNEKHEHNPHFKELIALKIIELLIIAERLYSELHDLEEKQGNLDIVRTFTDLVEQNFTKHRSVGFYASALHLHPNYLNLLIKNSTGFKAKESIQNRLLLEAKYLLHSTSLSVKEISNQLGFDDPNYFTVFFKRFEGISPISYRTSFI